MTDGLTREQAAASLARADMAARRVHGSTRWMSVYFSVFGAFFGAQTLILGLVQPLALRMTIFAVSVPAVMTGMIVWALRHGAVPRGRFRGLWAWFGSTGLYGAALIVGTPRLEGRLWYWIPASVLVALPLCLAGWRERRG
jgi:hypothetical protein